MSAHEPRKARRLWLAGVASTATMVVVGILVVRLVRLVTEARRMAAVATPRSSASPREPSPENFEVKAPRKAAYSNIYKYDYVGPETCSKCHAKNYELWRGHPHSKMNKNPNAATVVGDFSGTRLDYGGDNVVFAKDRGEFVMTISHSGKPVRQYMVTRTVGSRFVQMYMGVQTEGPDPIGDPVYAVEAKLPFAYWISRAEWFPQTYDENPEVSEYDERGELTAYYTFREKAVGSWKRDCAKCHNTYPYARRFDDGPDSRLIGFPPQDVALKVKSPGAVVLHKHPAEIEPSELVTLGISCESCHFGGREHAQSGARISFLPRSQDLQLSNAAGETPGRATAYAINSICRQCHASDPQGPPYPDGAASWNSREAEDLLGGACQGAIACTDCHNPHEAGPTAPDAVDRPSQVDACVRCHTKLDGAEPAAAHAAHPKGVKISCLDCHMPRIVHGLAGMTRTHHIGSPTDPRMLKGDYPNACNMCHLDKSLRWTLDALAARWNKKPAMGDDFRPSDEPLGPVWLRHKVPVVHQVAAMAYARSPLGKESLPLVLPILNDANPPSRIFGALAVEWILGRRLALEEYSPWATPSVRKGQVADLGSLAVKRPP